MPDPASTTVGAEVFDVRYNPPGIASQAANRFKLYGDGKLLLRPDSIELSGSVRTLFRTRAAPELRFPLDRIVNVQQAGTVVAFDIADPQGTARVVVWLKDEDAARRLASRLPPTQTVAFQKAAREFVDFSQRLRTVSPRAIVTRVIVGANVIVFIGMALSGAGVVNVNPVVHLLWGSNFGPLTLHGQWWRLLTSMFIHFGLMHVAFNMWALWLYGNITERLFGSARFALLYGVSGVAGSIASVLLHPVANSAGASGAIFGVFGGMFAFLMLRRTGVPVSIVTSHRNSLLVVLGLNLFLGFVHPGIDNAAHIGGLLAGFLSGLVLARPLSPEHREPAPGRVLAFGLVAMALLASIFAGGSGQAIQRIPDPGEMSRPAEGT